MRNEPALVRRLRSLSRAAAGLALVGAAPFALASCTAWPSAPSCGAPQSDHTAAIDADPVVQCFKQAAAACVHKELDVTGLMNDNSVDQHFVVTPADHCRIDDYVTHYLNSIPNTSLDWQCAAFAELPNWGLVLTGCAPPVQCYLDLGSPVVDPPAVTAASPGVTPPAGKNPGPAPSAGPGEPAATGQAHC